MSTTQDALSVIEAANVEAVVTEIEASAAVTEARAEVAIAQAEADTAIANATEAQAEAIVAASIPTSNEEYQQCREELARLTSTVQAQAEQLRSLESSNQQQSQQIAEQAGTLASLLTLQAQSQPKPAEPLTESVPPPTSEANPTSASPQPEPPKKDSSAKRKIRKI